MKTERLPSGTYRVRVMVDGKRYTFTDKDPKRVRAEAARFADEYREKIDNPTFADAMEKYITDRSSIRSPGTIRGYRSIQRGFLERYPDLCKKRVVQIRQQDLQDVVYTLDVSAKTVENYINFAKSVLGKKYKLAMPTKEPARIEVPTDLEIAGLIRVCQSYCPDLLIPVLLGAFGPLRRGEICALTLDDFDGDYVTVNKAMAKAEDGHFYLKEPKTPSSNRTIKMPHFVVSMIRRQGCVIKYNPDWITKHFASVQKKIGIDEPYHFHCLRHYCVSTLHAHNIPDEYIMERGGWASPYVLIKVYRHILSDKQIELTDKALRHFDGVTNFVTNASLISEKI